MNTIDITRLPKLMDGLIEPQNVGEEFFVEGYKLGLMDELLVNVFFTLKDEIDNLDKDVLFMLCLGYGMGQKDFKDEDTEDIEKLFNNKRLTH